MHLTKAAFTLEGPLFVEKFLLRVACAHWPHER